MVVRVDPATRQPAIFASVETQTTAPSDPGGERSNGLRALAAGLEALWIVPSPGEQLIRLDPVTGSLEAIDLPFPVGELTVGKDAVFAVSQMDGVLRVEPGAAPKSALRGQTLRLLATSESLVWTVDDAAATVMALDADSLEVVRSFHHLGAPEALFALDRRAWYLALPEKLLAPEKGRQERALIISFGRPEVDMLSFDAASGELRRVGSCRATEASAMDGESLWIAAFSEETEEEDPATELSRITLDGDTLLSVSRPGQIGAIAIGDGIVWVAGFRRSRQCDVLNSLARDGSETGEVDLSVIDLSPWVAPPRPRPTLSPAERARGVRKVVEQCLSEPSRVTSRFGDEWEEPPVSSHFRLDRVEIQGSDRSPEIAVLFRWDGETDLFGMRFPLDQGDPFIDDSPDALISVCVDENLLAGSLGVHNAEREHADGVTWLTWREWDDEE